MVLVPTIPISVQVSNPHEGVLELISHIKQDWIKENTDKGREITIKTFSDGITNTIIGVKLEGSHPKETVLVKVYGEKTELFIDRAKEIETFRVLSEAECGAELYAVFNNGICYEYFHGECLTTDSCHTPGIYDLVAKQLARVHKSVPTGDNEESQIWTRMESFLETIDQVMEKKSSMVEKLQKIGISVSQLHQDFSEIRSVLEKQEMPVVFCHNDLSLLNVVHNTEENSVKFIDFEYAFPNYAPFDVANHFMEWAGLDNPDYSKCPEKATQNKWIQEYLKELGNDVKFTQEQFERWVDLCTPLSDLFWIVWCIIQAGVSSIKFDYLGYAEVRYTKFKKHMKEMDCHHKI